MFFAFIPIILSSFILMHFKYMELGKLWKESFSYESNEDCPQSLREYFSSNNIARCLPVSSDHRGAGEKNRADELICLILRESNLSLQQINLSNNKREEIQCNYQ